MWSFYSANLTQRLITAEFGSAQLGLPDQLFLSFSDRPGPMTKREVRLLFWENSLSSRTNYLGCGAGTGSVSIEIAGYFPRLWCMRSRKLLLALP